MIEERHQRIAWPIRDVQDSMVQTETVGNLCLKPYFLPRDVSIVIAARIRKGVENKYRHEPTENELRDALYEIKRVIDENHFILKAIIECLRLTVGADSSINDEQRFAS